MPLDKITRRNQANPDLCFALGISCGGCIQHEVSTLEPTQSVKTARELFALRYPSKGCAGMAYSFVRLLTAQPKKKEAA